MKSKPKKPSKPAKPAPSPAEIVAKELARLNALGSAKAIAKDLKNKGCEVGPEWNGKSCPVASRLVSLGSGTVYVWMCKVHESSVQGKEIAEVNGFVSDFISDFDDGNFPELVKS